MPARDIDDQAPDFADLSGLRFAFPARPNVAAANLYLPRPAADLDLSVKGEPSPLATPSL
jgi:hypothetical protein